MCRPRILLADDHDGATALLRALLDSDFEVLDSVRDGRALVCAARQLAPDVIVADISMPLLDGIAAATEIRRADPAARIVFVSMHADPLVVDRGLATGALGYVLKLAAGDELLPAIRAALDGRRYISRALSCSRQPDPASASEA